jgi:BirA family biotin operon repressor/biotin-[acetyl-CoA-carboxylase] ligase
MHPREEWHLDTRHVGRRVLVYDRVESTNTLAALLASQPGHEGVVVLASEQTAGRGQYGRSWQSPAGTSVLLSALLFPPPALRRPAVLTAWAAVSVCETVRRAAGLQARIKWPNDVLVRGKKVCGILIEQGRGTVVGIGLNVSQPADFFAAHGLTQAASLALFSLAPLDWTKVARQLISQLDSEYQPLHGVDL